MYLESPNTCPRTPIQVDARVLVVLDNLSKKKGPLTWPWIGWSHDAYAYAHVVRILVCSGCRVLGHTATAVPGHWPSYEYSQSILSMRYYSSVIARDLHIAASRRTRTLKHCHTYMPNPVDVRCRPTPLGLVHARCNNGRACNAPRCIRCDANASGYEGPRALAPRTGHTLAAQVDACMWLTDARMAGGWRLAAGS